MNNANANLVSLALCLGICSCGGGSCALRAEHGMASAVNPGAERAVPASEPVIIDTRSSQEYAEGHLEGALLMPYDMIGGLIEARFPDKNTPIMLYCRSGGRAEMARKTLVSLNYAKVENLGGLLEASEVLKKVVVK